ncbi:MAG: glycosyltransferase family 2 protein [Bacteroidales bacterium]|nr:glycosyltransferase family 2 protein [Bacteroidales bacterium]
MMIENSQKDISFPSVGIIIPIWNAGIFLKPLLESLLIQRYPNLTFICVLDKPTDGSDSVVKSYAVRDKRFIILENERNVGIAESRNRGIEYAISKGFIYIGFADHDDYVEKDAYSRMVLSLETTLGDVVCANTMVEYSDHHDLVRFGSPSRDGILQSLFLPMSSDKNLNYLSRSIWNSLYRLSVIEKFSIRFLDRNTFFEEDTLFNIEVYLHTDKTVYLDELVYHWVQHQSSTSSSSETHERWIYKITNYFEYERKIVGSNSTLAHFVPDIQVNLSWFLRRYYSVISHMGRPVQQRLSSLLRYFCYPIGGRYENMKIISRTRLRLFFFVIWIKYFI